MPVIFERYMDSKLFNGKFFAVTLLQHRVLGNTFNAHILQLFNEKAGIYGACDNISVHNYKKWESALPTSGEKLLKLIDQISEIQLFKVIGKGKGTIVSFFNEVAKNQTLYNYLFTYVDQRLSKIFDILISEGIPTFLKDKKFNNIYHDQLLKLYNENAQPIFKFTRTPEELKYTLLATCEGEKINLKTSNSEVICNNPCVVRLNKKVLRFEGIDAKKLSPFFQKSHISIPKQTEKKYFETFVKNAVRDNIVENEGFEIRESKIEPQAVFSLEPTLSGNLGLVAKFYYGKKWYLSSSSFQNEVVLDEENGTFVFTKFQRNREWEKEMISRCEKMGLAITKEWDFFPQKLGNVDTNLRLYALIHWINENKSTIENSGFTVEQIPGSSNFYLNGFNLDFQAQTSQDWFDIYGTVKLKDFEVPFIYFKKNILKGIREFTLPNGEIFILPTEWFTNYKDLLALGQESDSHVRLKNHHFKIIELVSPQCADAETLSNRFRSISETSETIIPEKLNAQLRNYQIQGLRWMQILHENKLNGCLADDMGLGKTLQTLAMLLFAKQKNISENSTDAKTSLIIVPTSLLFNWQRELQRFAPTLSFYQFTGTHRAKNAGIFNAFDLVFTTYGVMRNDIELLKKFKFNYVVFDESQTLKNSDSKGYKAALQIDANHFVSLSGTPIENSLSDLWSQLNLLNRGMLGSLKFFTDEYINPIEKENDEGKIAKLKNLVEPFILRRTKEQVAPDLPDLTEQVLYCDLTDEQKKLYEEEKSAIRNHIIQSISSLGYNKSTILILRALTRLRQLANHPRMIDAESKADSGKFQEIARSVESIVAEGHKILIFSSFVKHLNIVEEFLAESKIGYQKLTGSTVNRKEVVSDFQTNPKVKVFLISIKAGGVGLNLTAADYIFVLDPWWNPATENQAIARAHRIGQDKKVFVYRFISAETIEEKILDLQERKAILADKFVGSTNPLSLISQEKVLEMVS
ncbi:MAG TPA: DEAD/DEAH box helicase [Tenuifilaceae bacterium]|nr:DEAD/DEAH box helicase [Tenuifilaceae bacterium]